MMSFMTRYERYSGQNPEDKENGKGMRYIKLFLLRSPFN